MSLSLDDMVLSSSRLYRRRRYYGLKIRHQFQFLHFGNSYVAWVIMPSPYGQNNDIIDTLKQDDISTDINYQHPHNSQLKSKDIYKRNLKSRKTIIFSLLVPSIIQDIFTTWRYAFQIHLKENTDFRQSVSASKDILNDIFLHPSVSNVSQDRQFKWKIIMLCLPVKNFGNN